MQDYKKLMVWEKAHALTLDIYKITKSFPKDEQYGIVAQLRRSSSSIPANIVEGCGRKTNPDFARFLSMAIGSANETEYFILLSKDLQYISDNEFESLTQSTIEVRKMLIALTSKLHS